MKRMILGKNLKKMICFLLCLLLVFGLAGCGCGKEKKESKSKNKTESVKEDSKDNKDTADEETSEASAQEAEKNTDKAADSEASKKDGAVDTTIGGTTQEGSGQSGQVVSANTMEVNSETKKSGEEFVITIQAGENTPVAAYTMELSYDASKLQVVEYGRTEAFKEAYTGMCAENDKGGTVVFAGVNANQHQQYYTGDMLYVKFKAIGEAGSVSDVKLNVIEAVPYDGENAAGAFTVKSGTVTIE